MINTYKIYTDLLDSLGETSAKKLTEILGGIYEDLQNTVTKEDFRNLNNAVEGLAEAQKRTETRIGELAESQDKTEKRLETLAISQDKTEKRLEALAISQDKTEKRLEALARAQEKTEACLRRLSGEQIETRKQLGGLSNTVGYRLEDLAYRSLPGLLERDHGIQLSERPIRRYIRDNKGKEIEVNILGKAQKEGQDITVVGESKSQLSKKDIDRFRRTRLKRLDGVFPEIFPVLITYMISQPDVEDYAAEKGIAVYYSYDFH